MADHPTSPGAAAAHGISLKGSDMFELIIHVLAAVERYPSHPEPQVIVRDLSAAECERLREPLAIEWSGTLYVR